MLCNVLELLKRFASSNIDGWTVTRYIARHCLLAIRYMKGSLMETNDKDYAWRSS
jgi:hypothetical protein